MPFTQLQNKFLLFTAIMILISNNLLLGSESPVLSAKLDLVDKDNWCVKLIIENISNKDVFIEKVGAVFRGKEPFTPFYVFSNEGKRYQYIGPLDERRKINEDNFLLLKSGQGNKNCFCLDNLFKIDNGASKIFYEEIELYYDSPNESDYMNSDRILKSNIISF